MSPLKSGLDKTNSKHYSIPHGTLAPGRILTAFTTRIRLTHPTSLMNKWNHWGTITKGFSQNNFSRIHDRAQAASTAGCPPLRAPPKLSLLVGQRISSRECSYILNSCIPFADCITAMIVPKPPPQQAAPLHVPAPTPREPDEDEDLVSSRRLS
jgi:hypothetical protein